MNLNPLQNKSELPIKYNITPQNPKSITTGTQTEQSSKIEKAQSP